MQVPRRSHAELMTLRDQLAAHEMAVDPKDLETGDVFYVIQFAPLDGVTVAHSGVFYGPTHDKGLPHLVVHLDGESARRHLTPAQLGFYPNGSAMSVVLRTLDRVAFDRDNRTAYAQTVARRRVPCPCGAINGDGSRCADWPECVIP